MSIWKKALYIWSVMLSAGSTALASVDLEHTPMYLFFAVSIMGMALLSALQDFTEEQK